jgi:hypothetical protein
VFDAIRFHSRLSPELPGLVAFDSAARELSYADIAKRVDAVTLLLTRSGIASGLRIGVHCHDRLQHIIAVLALSRIGEATFVFAPDGAFAPGSIDILVTDKAADDDGRTKIILLDSQSSTRPDLEHTALVKDRSGKANWLFNGEPGRSAIALEGAVLSARIGQRSKARAAGGAARWLCAADIRTELGLSAVIENLWSGGLAILSNGTFSEDVLPIRLYEADHLLVGGEHAGEYLNGFDKADGTSARLRSAVIAGACPDDSSAERMKRLISPDTVLHLDLPETGTFAACSYWQIGKPRHYWPLPGVELRVVANGASPSDANAPGCVAIRSDGALRPRSGDGTGGRFLDGWFHSPLAGSFARDGALVLS